MLSLWFSRALEYDTYLYTYVTFPSTVMHEGMHYLFAALLGGNPMLPTLTPRMHYVDGQLAAIQQGGVIFHMNEYDVAASALAPLTLLPVPLFFTYLMMKTESLTWKILFFYMSICGWAAIMPSDIDFNLALSAPETWLYAAVLLPTMLILNSVLLFVAAKRYNR